MKNVCKSLALLVFSLGLQAGTSTFTGNGTSAPREPEFITVDISVKSDCYLSPHGAMKENNKITTEIQAFLEGLIVKGNDVDRVLVQGGTTSPSSRTIYSNGETKAVCPGGFEQTTYLSFKTANVVGFSEVFARIQEEVLNKYLKVSDDSGDPRTFASIGSPSAGVCSKTSKLMAEEALANAFADARAQFDTVATKCGISKGELTYFGDAEQNSYSNRKSYAAEAMFAPSSDIVNLSFEPISESRSISVKFSYPETTFTCTMGQ